jgi:hypothetical protein
MVENLIETVVSVSVVVVIRIGSKGLDGAGGSVAGVGGIVVSACVVGIAGSSTDSIGTSAIETRVPRGIVTMIFNNKTRSLIYSMKKIYNLYIYP